MHLPLSAISIPVGVSPRTPLTFFLLSSYSGRVRTSPNGIPVNASLGGGLTKALLHLQRLRRLRSSPTSAPVDAYIRRVACIAFLHWPFVRRLLLSYPLRPLKETLPCLLLPPTRTPHCQQTCAQQHSWTLCHLPCVSGAFLYCRPPRNSLLTPPRPKPLLTFSC